MFQNFQIYKSNLHETVKILFLFLSQLTLIKLPTALETIPTGPVRSGIAFPSLASSCRITKRDTCKNQKVKNYYQLANDKELINGLVETGGRWFKKTKLFSENWRYSWLITRKNWKSITYQWKTEKKFEKKIWKKFFFAFFKNLEKIAKTSLQNFAKNAKKKYKKLIN